MTPNRDDDIVIDLGAASATTRGGVVHADEFGDPEM